MEAYIRRELVLGYASYDSVKRGHHPPEQINFVKVGGSRGNINSGFGGLFGGGNLEGIKLDPYLEHK